MSPSSQHFESKSLSNPADVYNGIVNSLSTEQGDAFDEFRDQLGQQGLREAPTGIESEDVCDGINDDSTLLRFLRARSYVVEDAIKQFKEAFTIRNNADLAKIYDGQDVADFEETRHLYSHWTGRRDKRGLPLLMLDMKSMDSKAMAAYYKSCSARASAWPTSGDNTVEQLRSLGFHDDIIRFVIPLCSAAKDRPNPEKPITSTVHIADISTLGLRQFWSLKNFLLEFAKLLSTNIPETLDAVLVIGSPSYFPTIWAWIKKFVDPGTVSKLNILRANEVLPTLLSYIDNDNIPKRYGGNLDWEHGMPLTLDPALGEMLDWSTPAKKFPGGPLKWVDGQNGAKEIIAVGSVGAKKRHEKIATLKSAERPHAEEKLIKPEPTSAAPTVSKSTRPKSSASQTTTDERTKSPIAVSNPDVAASSSTTTETPHHSANIGSSNPEPDPSARKPSTISTPPSQHAPSYPIPLRSHTRIPTVTKPAKPSARSPSTAQNPQPPPPPLSTQAPIAPNIKPTKIDAFLGLSTRHTTHPPPHDANTTTTTNLYTTSSSSRSHHEDENEDAGDNNDSDTEKEDDAHAVDHFVDAKAWHDEPVPVPHRISYIPTTSSMPKDDVAPYPALTATTTTTAAGTNPTVHIPHVCTCSCAGYNLANAHSNAVPKTVDMNDKSQSVTTITITITSTSPSPSPSTAASISTTTTTTPGTPVPVGGTTITIHTPGASSPITVAPTATGPGAGATVTQRTNTTWASGSTSTSPPAAAAPAPAVGMKKRGVVGHLGRRE